MMNELDQKILHSRAQLLAVPDIDLTKSEEQLAIVNFSLHPEKYAFEVSYVAEVLTMNDLTPIPGTPAFIMGVINLRGHIVSVVNPKIFFGLTDGGLTQLNKILVISNGQMIFGVLADEIYGFSTFPAHQLLAPPNNLSGVLADFVKGTLADGTILLSANQMLNSQHLVIQD